MEKNLGGHYIPVKLKADGSYTAGSLQTLEGFGSLMREISVIIGKLGKHMKDGRADAVPLKKGGHNACEYCSVKPVCRTGNFR
jgi:ATP-dependent helicase/nuclease subunit B